MTIASIIPLDPPMSPEAELHAALDRIRQLGAAVSWDNPLGGEIADLAESVLARLAGSLVLVAPIDAAVPRPAPAVAAAPALAA